MAVIRVPADDAEYQGRTWGSIARRIWGDAAQVQVGELIGDGVRTGQILNPMPKEGGSHPSYEVIATVVLYDMTD